MGQHGMLGDVVIVRMKMPMERSMLDCLCNDVCCTEQYAKQCLYLPGGSSHRLAVRGVSPGGRLSDLADDRGEAPPSPDGSGTGTIRFETSLIASNGKIKNARDCPSPGQS